MERKSDKNLARLVAEKYEFDMMRKNNSTKFNKYNCKQTNIDIYKKLSFDNEAIAYSTDDEIEKKYVNALEELEELRRECHIYKSDRYDEEELEYFDVNLFTKYKEDDEYARRIESTIGTIEYSLLDRKNLDRQLKLRGCSILTGSRTYKNNKVKKLYKKTR